MDRVSLEHARPHSRLCGRGRKIGEMIIRKTTGRVFVVTLLTLAAFLGVSSQVKDDSRPVFDDSKTPPQQVHDPKLPTLWIVGDSTLNSNAPLRGWGQELAQFFDLTKINVVNRAIGGRSSRTC